jgi:type VI protein secretion system component VasF
MAVVQALFALRCFRNPEAAKLINVEQGTIWAKLPLSFYRALGVLCAGAAILFLYLFLGWTRSYTK